MCNTEIVRISKENKEILDKIRIKLQENIGKRPKITYNDVISYLSGENISFIKENTDFTERTCFFYGTPREVMWEAKGLISLQIFKYNGRNGYITGDINDRKKES